MPYLSKRALEGLKAYAYKPSGYTWLDNLHNPFWNWLVDQLPLWFAPNLITLIGLLGVVLCSWLNAFFLPNYEGSAPTWIWVLVGASVVFYANLDCIDGKQARRTQSSSPLGQLFDHGCDAYIVHLLVGVMVSCFNITCGWQAANGVLWIMCPWILAQLEEYHTGMMVYGNGVCGVLEALYATTSICWARALIGDSIWDVQIISLSPEWNVVSRDVAVGVVTITGIIQSIGQTKRILTSNGTSLKFEEKGNKQLGFTNALWHVIFVVLLLASGTFWIATASPNSCRLVSTSYGTVYAIFATQLIVAHMAKIEFVPFWWTLPSLILFVGVSYLKIFDPTGVAVLSFFLYNLAYGHYCYSIVQQICQYLNIKCLTITKPSKDEGKEQLRKSS